MVATVSQTAISRFLEAKEQGKFLDEEHERQYTPDANGVTPRERFKRSKLFRDIHQVIDLANELACLAESVTDRIDDPVVTGAVFESDHEAMKRDLLGIAYNAGMAASCIATFIPDKPKSK